MSDWQENKAKRSDTPPNQANCRPRLQKASNTEEFDYSGWSVSVSGVTVVAGASHEDSDVSGVDGNQSDNSANYSGAAYVFDLNLGTSYCGPAVTNSAGLSGLIRAQGSTTVADNHVTLTALNLPPNQFAIFINSLQQGFTPGAGGSQGNLCVIGFIGRYNPAAGYPVQSSGAAGSLSIQLDLSEHADAFRYGDGHGR